MFDHLDVYIGPAAGVATSALWTATSLFFTAAAKRIGSTRVNGVRILLAILMLALTLRLVSGAWWPDGTVAQMLLLGASGILGLAIGDQALLISFVLIGPRLALLVMTTSPLIATLFGFVALHEVLSPIAWVGMGITIAGVASVVLERPEADGRSRPRHYAIGLLLAFVGAACQAGGLLLSKQGMGHGWSDDTPRLDPLGATLVRMAFAGLAILPMLAWRWKARRQSGVGAATDSRETARGWLLTGAGAIVGPYLGVWMSLVAADRIPVGAAQTLCSLTPVFILPFSARLHRERIGARAVLGAIAAVAGSAMLFLAPS